MWELDYKESWGLKNWWLGEELVLEKNFESPLNCKEMKSVNPKGNQSWTFIGRTDVEAEARILWPPDAINWLIGKDPDIGKDWRQEEKGMSKHVMVGWHHRFHGHEFEQTSGVGDGQGNLVCCSPWGRKELDTTELTDWVVISNETRVQRSEKRRGRGQRDSRQNSDRLGKARQREREIRAEMEREAENKTKGRDGEKQAEMDKCQREK